MIVPIITGLESSILLDTNPDKPAVLQIMNLAREKYPKSFQHPVIIMVSERIIQKIQQQAPDFWSWRSGEPEIFDASHIDQELDLIFPLS
ncbi:hypothetical protein MHK_009403 [Candidatus Magnetomorum sp. HK-1]|nr:hypothetical protein MHK_009403 [Candidatus Magnetomorum sp. HK-1]